MEYKIYVMIDPRTNQVRYVGKAKHTLVKRLSGHLSSHELKQKHKRASWLKSLLALGFKPIIVLIDEVKTEEVNFWERHYISLYKSWGFNLTNSTQGGDGGATTCGRKQSFEVIQKRIEARRNNGKPWVSDQRKEEVRNQMKGNQIRKGKSHTQATKDYLKQINKERSSTAEFKNKMREANLGNTNRKGKSMSAESKMLLQRKVTQKDKNGNVLNYFNGIAEAERLTNIKGIGNCLTGRAKTAGKFIWEYTV